MNFDYKIKELKEIHRRFYDKLEAIKNQLETAHIFTAAFLKKCSDAGYTAVAISRTHKSIPQSIDFPFGSDGSVFAHKKGAGRKNEPRIDGWPAIWQITVEMNIGVGCGNSHQKQINTAQLIDGVYHFKDGNWKRIE